MTCGKILIFATALFSAAPAAAASSRITGLADVNFGSILSAGHRTSSQSVIVCSYKNNPQDLPYSVTATGSGSGGAFQLESGAAFLPFDVQWADSAGQTGGTLLQAGRPAAGFSNGATGFACSTQGGNASLTVTIRSADIAEAPAGTYAGTLQLMIAPQ
ncbi:hypothetical protein C0V74_12730 [Altererythrobacter sp. TH136]|nr:hypothetical protein C0V74_12730 [Altererythrobacter sp. TH136]